MSTHAQEAVALIVAVLAGLSCSAVVLSELRESRSRVDAASRRRVRQERHALVREFKVALDADLIVAAPYGACASPRHEVYWRLQYGRWLYRRDLLVCMSKESLEVLLQAHQSGRWAPVEATLYLATATSREVRTAVSDVILTADGLAPLDTGQGRAALLRGRALSVPELDDLLGALEKVRAIELSGERSLTRRRPPIPLAHVPTKEYRDGQEGRSAG